MKVKKIYKYGTGDAIPEGAIYLSTITQTEIEVFDSRDGASVAKSHYEKCWFVWHYFLVEIYET